MSRSSSDRVPNVDVAWATRLAESFADAYREVTSEWRTERVLPQPVECALAGDYAIDAAMVTYALGAPYSEVRAWLTRALAALTMLFEQPLGAPGIPVRIAGPGGEITEPESVPIDRSLTGAERALLALQIACIAGDAASIERLARRIDGRSAPSVLPGTRAELDEDRSLALALAALLRGEIAVAAFHAAGVAASEEDTQLRAQAQALIETIERDRPRWSRAWQRVLDMHAESASDPELEREPRSFLCLPALALAALASKHGVCSADELPAQSLYCPVELLTRPSEREEPAS